MIPAESFVRCRGTRFVVGNRPFPAVGVNCYFLARCSELSRRAAMTVAKQMGANVIRTWAFPDTNFEQLDALIQAAEDLDLRLILPLINYWPDFGGMPACLESLDIKEGVAEFYRSTDARFAYRNWVERVLTRYSEEPSIMAWELANEPRCETKGGRNLLLDWAAEMSCFVKQLDANHLLALGDEGFFGGSHGVDCEAILALGEIDFGTYHFYPQNWGYAAQLDFADKWIADHIAAGAQANKPVLLEEYGLKVSGPSVRSPAERDEWFARWLGSVQEMGGAGDLLWMLGGSEADTAGYRDEYTILTAAEVPAIANHAEQMAMDLLPSS
jgi:mannan endo-1,4-beta-mannosidase